MKTQLPFYLLALLSAPSYAVDTFYCPQKSAYITIGMTQAQVLAACGVPLSKQASNTPPTQKVPVRQLIFNSINQGSIYPGLDNVYNQWSIPNGMTGMNVQVDIIDNKVSSIKLNGSNTNALTICGGMNLQVGAPENQVYNACGTPTMVNDTYLNQTVPSTTRPEVWIYQVDRYHSPYSLTFVNGKLESID